MGGFKGRSIWRFINRSPYWRIFTERSNNHPTGATPRIKHHELSKTFTIKVALILSAAYQIPDLNSATNDKDTETEAAVDNTSTQPQTVVSNIDDSTEKSLDQSSHQLMPSDRDVFALRTGYIQFTSFDSSRSLKGKVQKLLNNLITREEDLLMRGSGWRFESLSFSDIQITNI